jgi:hypothetical protein
MPFTEKGLKVRRQMRKTYKTTKKVDEVFYSMINDGTLTGVETSKKRKSKRKK